MRNLVFIILILLLWMILATACLGIQYAPPAGIQRTYDVNDFPFPIDVNNVRGIMLGFLLSEVGVEVRHDLEFCDPEGLEVEVSINRAPLNVNGMDLDRSVRPNAVKLEFSTTDQIFLCWTPDANEVCRPKYVQLEFTDIGVITWLPRRRPVAARNIRATDGIISNITYATVVLYAYPTNLPVVVHLINHKAFTPRQELILRNFDWKPWPGCTRKK